MATAREQFLFDLFVTAVEGGVNYWAAVRKYSYDEDACSASAVLVDIEDGKRYPISIATVRSGLTKVLDSGFQIAGDIRNAIQRASSSNDAGDIDAAAADCIIQAGLFGEIVFG